MALDFQQSTEHVENTTCKSVLFINCTDFEQNNYIVKVTNFRSYFYVMAPEFEEQGKIPEHLRDLKKRLNKLFSNSVHDIIVV